jgi:hypothetical protein
MQVRNLEGEIQYGMSVCDADGNRIGVVTHIHTSTDRFDMNTVNLRHLKKTMQELMGGDTDFPYAVYARFYREGFVRVSYGKLNMYFIPRQVDMVVGSQVHLRVAGEDLLAG